MPRYLRTLPGEVLDGEEEHVGVGFGGGNHVVLQSADCQLLSVEQRIHVFSIFYSSLFLG